jgi:ribosomal protein L18E
MISKTQIDTRMKRKTNSYLAQAIILAKKTENLELAAVLSGPTRKQANINVGRLNEVKSDVAIIPGKVLNDGELSGKKLKVYALGFSDKALEKLKKAGCECKTILEALKSLKKGEKLKGEIIK